MNKKIHLSILTVFAIASMVGSILLVGSDNAAMATKKSNDAAQFLGQFSGSQQFAECSTDNNTLASCNNVGIALDGQEGNNAEGQQ